MYEFALESSQSHYIPNFVNIIYRFHRPKVKNFSVKKVFSKGSMETVWFATCRMWVRERKKTQDIRVCPCGLTFRPLCSTGSCHAAKLTWETHRTAELNRITAGCSMARAFHPCTTILKRERVSEAFRKKAHLDAALFKIWPCTCWLE